MESGGAGQRPEPGESGDEKADPPPRSLQAQMKPAPAAAEAAGYVEQAVAQALRLPSSWHSGRQQELTGPGHQVGGHEHQLEPRLVGSEVAEGKVPQPGLLAAANPVLDAGVAAMEGLEIGDVRVGLVGDEDLVAGADGVGEAELGAGMGDLAAADGASTRRPAG